MENSTQGRSDEQQEGNEKIVSWIMKVWIVFVILLSLFETWGHFFP